MQILNLLNQKFLLRFLPPNQRKFFGWKAMLAFALVMMQYVAQAQTQRCNGGSFVTWTSEYNTGATGTLVDLDGNTVNVTVTGSTLNIANNFSGNPAAWSPTSSKLMLNIDNAAEPQVTGTGPFTYTYTFSQAVADPIMLFYSIGNASKHIRYTFKDGSGNPVNFNVRKTDDAARFYETSGNQLNGIEGDGTIQFEGNITTLVMEVVYITGNTAESWTGLTFGVACPEQSFDFCPSPAVVNWTSNTAGTAVGSVVDADGNTVNVTLTGSIVNTGFAGEFNNANLYDPVNTGERVAIDNANEPQQTGTGPFYYTWDLSRPVKKPIFNIYSMGINGKRLQYTFTNEDDEPLDFVVRKANNWEDFHQVAGNILEGEEGTGSIQFDGTPQKIKIKVVYLTGATVESWTSFQLIVSCPAPEPADAYGGKCNGANFAQWNTVSPSSVVGTIQDVNGIGSSITGSGSMINIGYAGYFNNANAYSLKSRYADRVAIDNAAQPQQTGTGPFLYTWTISNPITNLNMYFYSIGRAGQRIQYTFKDASGNPIPFTVVSTDNAARFTKVGANQLQGEEGNGIIRFDVPVTVIQMETTFITGSTAEYWTGITFASVCDPTPALVACPLPKFANWGSNTASTASATVQDENNNTISVTLSGSIINTGYPGQFVNTNIWNPTSSTATRVAIDNAAEPQVTGTGPFTYTFNLSQVLNNPILNFYSIGRAGVRIQYTFKDAADNPLTFCVRKTNDWETFRQVDENVLVGQEGSGSIQFIGSTDVIKMEVTYLTGSTAEYWTSIQLVGGCLINMVLSKATINQSVSTNQAKTGNAATEVKPSGGTSPYTFSNGSSDPACVAPSGATPLPSGSNLVVNSNGTYSYTAPSTPGTYYFCIKVCDNASPTPTCKFATYKVTVSPPPPDTDGDGILDNIDQDDDNDGIRDIDENSGATCNLISNGGFNTNLASWIRTGNVAHNTFSGQGYVAFNATNTSPNGVMYQDVTTTASTAYSLAYSYHKQGTGTSTVSVKVDVIDVATNTVLATVVHTPIPGIGVTHALPFSAMGASTRIRFTDQSEGTTDVDICVDAVSISTCDNDGIPNHLDTDSDNDGCPDAVEGGAAFTVAGGQVNGTSGRLTGTVATNGIPTLAGTGQTVGNSQNAAVNDCPPIDTDGDGVADATDQDDDNDGISDATEGTGDTDGDGVADSKDLDSDNDGINDVREAGGTDANGDGKQDGTPNATTGQIGTALTPPNSDNDPLPDYKDLDSDNDAVSDYQEKGGTLGTDADNDGVVDGPDADSDGIPDSVDAFTSFGDASDPTPVNTDGADTPDYRDPDSDNNGTMDIAQKAGKGALDANNDGQVDSPTDPDGDGIPNNGTPALDSKPTGFGGLALASGPLNGTISAKVFLQGPLNSTGTQMTNTLSTGTTPLIPLTDPYGLNATTTISTLQSNSVTDWVRVELRTTPAATTAPAESIAALLSNDGTLRNADGTTPLRFNTSTGNYYVSIRHRNHLGVMSANTVAISVTPVTVDFTQSTTATYGDGVSTPSQKTVGSVRAMWAGNASGLTSTGIDAIRNSGATGDRTAINNTLIANGSLSGLVSGYLNTDLNLDGVTRNSGASGDGTLLNNIILTHPSNSSSTLTNIFTQNF